MYLYARPAREFSVSKSIWKSFLRRSSKTFGCKYPSFEAHVFFWHPVRARQCAPEPEISFGFSRDSPMRIACLFCTSCKAVN